MKNYSTLAAVMAFAALGAPMVAQAQDPITAYNDVIKTAAAGNDDAVVSKCDAIIQRFGNPTSRTGKQFYHMVPFFYYQKAEALFRQKKYAEAYETYSILADENQPFAKEGKEKNIYKERARNATQGKDKNKQSPGYDPLLTTARFYKGYCLFQMAVGDPKKNIAGDPTQFPAAIKDLEAYLAIYERGKVSDGEKKAKLDGSICFMLMQAYILKPNATEADFTKAKEYLAKSKNARAPLSDEMAMSGLETLIKVAMQNTKYIGWPYEIVNSNPESFNLGTVRMAPYVANMLKHGAECYSIGRKFLQKGDTESACAAFRSAGMYFGLMSDTPDVLQSLEVYTRGLNTKDARVLDSGTGTWHIAGNYKAMSKNFKESLSKKQYLDAYAAMQYANIGTALGSKRLPKASAHILVERYPDIAIKQGDNMRNMRDDNLTQYASYCHATGDEKEAAKYEALVNPDNIDQNARVAVIANKMNGFVKDKNWKEVIPLAEQIMEAMKDHKNTMNYVAAKVAHYSGEYMMATAPSTPKEEKKRLFQAVISEIDSMLTGEDSACLTADGLKPEQKQNYINQGRFFVIHAYHEMPAASEEERIQNFKQCVACAESYIKDRGAELDKDKLAPNIYYFYIDSVLKLQTDAAKRAALAKDEKAAQECLEEGNKYASKALGLCKTMAEKWPNNPITPVCCLIGAQILRGTDYAALNPSDTICTQIKEQEEKANKTQGKQKKAEELAKLEALKQKLKAKENAQKEEAVRLLEVAYQGALAAEDEKKKDYATAAEALFQLCTLAPKCPNRPKESDAQRDTRIKGYEDFFKTSVYKSFPEDGTADTPHYGSSQALKLADMKLKAAAEPVRPEPVPNAAKLTDAEKKKAEAELAAKKAAAKDAFDAALKEAGKVIGSEARYCKARNIKSPDLEQTIVDYYIYFKKGHLSHNGAEPAKDVMLKEMTDFPETYKIKQDDVFARSLFAIRRVRAIEDELTRVKTTKVDSKDTEAVRKRDAASEQLQKEIDKAMDDFVATFKDPEALSNSVCSEVGDYFYEKALSNVKRNTFGEDDVQKCVVYFDAMLKNGGTLQDKAKLGKARIYALSKDSGHQQESQALFQDLLKSGDRKIAASAQVGVTRLYYTTGKYQDVIKAAKSYVGSIPARSSDSESVEMHTWYAESLVNTGDIDKALQIYMGIYNNNLGAVRVSAPACLRLMELYQKRDRSSSGVRANRTFTPSDKWVAWNLADRYVKGLERSKGMLPPAERDLFTKVEDAVRKLYNSSEVQAEEAANKEFARKVSK